MEEYDMEENYNKRKDIEEENNENKRRISPFCLESGGQRIF
jgi:hypothetical protein